MKKLIIVGSNPSPSLSQTIREAVKKAVNIFVPDGPTHKVTPTTILDEFTHTVSPADLDESGPMPEIVWRKIVTPRMPIESMKNRLWTYVILNYESGEVLFTVSARTIKDSAKKADDLYKLHYKSQREFPEAFWESLTKPILIGLHTRGQL